MARVVLVTGSTDGIGRATARQLAAAGARVIVHGRSKPKVDKAVAQLRGELPGATLDGVAFDLGTLAAVRRGAEQMLEVAPELHVLVNNAGIFATERVVTDDGLELDVRGQLRRRRSCSPSCCPGSTRGRRGVASRVIDVASVAHTRGRSTSTISNSSAVDRLRRVRAEQARERHARDVRSPSAAIRRKLVAYSLHPGVIATKLLRDGFGPVQVAGRSGRSHVGAARERRGGRRAVGHVLQRRRATPPSSRARCERASGCGARRCSRSSHAGTPGRLRRSRTDRRRRRSSRAGRIAARLGWPRGGSSRSCSAWLGVLAELAERRGAPELAELATRSRPRSGQPGSALRARLRADRRGRPRDRRERAVALPRARRRERTGRVRARVGARDALAYATRSSSSRRARRCARAASCAGT